MLEGDCGAHVDAVVGQGSLDQEKSEDSQKKSGGCRETHTKKEMKSDR